VKNACITNDEGGFTPSVIGLTDVDVQKRRELLMFIYQEREGHVIACAFALRRIIYAFGGYKYEVQMPFFRLSDFGSIIG
jgi:hypothetical protein